MAVIKGLSGAVTVSAGNSSVSIPAYGNPNVHPAHKVLADDIGLTWHRGFSRPHHYMLAASAPKGALQIDPGRTTRVFYFANAGKTYADIDADEGLPAGTVNANWILTQPVTGLVASPARYGETEALALDASVANDVMQAFYLTNIDAAPHFLFRGGDTFATPPIPNVPSTVSRNGESALHPIVLGSYGTGKPIIEGTLWNMTASNEYLVFSGLDWRSGFRLGGGVFGEGHGQRYVMWNDVALSGKSLDFIIPAAGFHEHVTLRDCCIQDCVLSAPVNGTDWTDQNADRYEGMYLTTSLHALFERVYFDRNGWAPGYDPAGAFPPGQPPSKFSHNLYCASSNSHTTWREFISTRAANSGMQMRQGGFALFALFGENNAAFGLGGSLGGAQNNYTELVNPVVMGGAVRQTQLGLDGAVDWNFSVTVADTTPNADAVVHQMIIAHGVDPNNPAELAAKGNPGGNAIDLRNASVLDRFWLNDPDIVKSGWFASADYRTGGLVEATMDTKTLGGFVDAKQTVTLGTNTTDDFCNYLRGLGTAAGAQARDIWNFLAPGFGFDVFNRTTAATLTFSPDPSGNGFRYEDPRNWIGAGWPGLHPDDSAELNGARVLIYEDRRVHPVLGLGLGGALEVWGGYCAVASAFTGTGAVRIHPGAQFWIGCDIASGAKTVDLFGGRLGIGAAVTGNLSISADVAEDEIEILIDEGNALTIASGQSMTLTGPDIWVGFDGDAGGGAALTIAGTLAFVARNGGLSKIREFYSGTYGLDANNRIKTPNVASSVTLAAGATVSVDATGLAPGSYDLIDVDTLTDSGASLPAGVAVVGNRLVLTVV